MAEDIEIPGSPGSVALAAQGAVKDWLAANHLRGARFDELHERVYMVVRAGVADVHRQAMDLADAGLLGDVAVDGQKEGQ